MKENNVIECENHISGKLKIIFEKIASIEFYYDLNEIMSMLKELDKEEKDSVLESMINTYLDEIKKISTQTNFLEARSEINEFLEYFSKEENGVIEEEAECVVDDLVLKIIGKNKRQINLPIKIEFIKNYCINNIIEQKDIDMTLKWIVLKLATICYILKTKVVN